MSKMYSTSGGGRHHRAALVFAVTATLLLVAWLATGGPGGRQEDHGGVPNIGVGGEAIAYSADGFGFAALPEMVATAHTVVLGTVIGERRGAVDDQDDVRYTQRLLTVRIEKVLAGRAAGQSLTISTTGWRQISGQAETRLRWEDYPRVDVGGRAVFFLFDGDGDGRYGFINRQGTYLVEGGALRPWHSHDPLVQRINGLSLAALEREIAAARTAVRRGEVRPQPAPGTPR
jgi:hypothetical protein